MIKTACPSCGNRFKVDEALLGKKGRCDRCREVFEIAPAPFSRKLGTLGLALAGLVILGIGIKMALGPGDGAGPEATGPVGGSQASTPVSGEGGAARSEPGDSGSSGVERGAPAGEGPASIQGGSGKGREGEDSEKGAAGDEALALWTDAAVLPLTDGRARELASVPLQAGQRILFNGRALRLEVVFEGLRLYLPRGRHQLVQDRQQRSIEVEGSYGARYRSQTLARSRGRALDYELIVRQKLGELDFPAEPALLNLLAGVYITRRQFAAARRYLQRALAEDPSFAPAHLNLAFVLFELDDREGARLELRLAEDLDAIGCFGLERGFARLRDRLLMKDEHPQVRMAPEQYRPPLPGDDPVANACYLLADFGRDHTDSVAALNNAGRHLLERKRYEDAHRVFLEALRRLRGETPTRRGRRVATVIYKNLARLFSEAKWPEKDEIPMMEELFP